MAAPLSTNSRYMVPSGFLPCIDYNLRDNEEILGSEVSEFSTIVTFNLTSVYYQHVLIISFLCCCVG